MNRILTERNNPELVAATLEGMGLDYTVFDGRGA